MPVSAPASTRSLRQTPPEPAPRPSHVDAEVEALVAQAEGMNEQVRRYGHARLSGFLDVEELEEHPKIIAELLGHAKVR